MEPNRPCTVTVCDVPLLFGSQFVGKSWSLYAGTPRVFERYPLCPGSGPPRSLQGLFSHHPEEENENLMQPPFSRTRHPPACEWCPFRRGRDPTRVVPRRCTDYG